MAPERAGIGRLRLTAGAAFYYGAKADAFWSSVTLDSSVVVENGLFLALRSGFDGQQLSMENLLARIGRMTDEVLQALDLELVGN